VSVYLSSGDLATYGVAGATDAQILAASRAIDAHLGRPEGLTWTAGADGAPAFMDNLTPRLALAAGQTFNAGSNVTVAVPNASMVSVGDVLIADRGVNNACEPLVVASATAASITFASVTLNHLSGAVLEAGLVIEEELHPTPQGLAQVGRRPMARCLSGSYRDAYGALYAADVAPSGPLYIQLTGLPYAGSGIGRGLTAGIAPRPRMPATTVRYLAGFPAAALPPAIKQATANLILAARSLPAGLGPGVKAFSAGQTSVERFGDSLFDGDTRDLLGEYQTLRFA
jgi:hypothetical protein